MLEGFLFHPAMWLVSNNTLDRMLFRLSPVNVTVFAFWAEPVLVMKQLFSGQS